MATSSPAVQSNMVSEPAKLPVVPLLVAVVVGIVVATMSVGGIVYFLARSGRLPVQSGRAAAVEAAVPSATHAMALEPLLVNLADVGGNAYLRVGVTLLVAEAMDKKPKDEKSSDGKGGKDAEFAAAVRDTALMVLSRQTSDELLSAGGKERLKTELRAALTEHNADLKVTDLFFTEFLVQR